MVQETSFVQSQTVGRQNSNRRGSVQRCLVLSGSRHHSGRDRALHRTSAVQIHDTVLAVEAAQIKLEKLEVDVYQPGISAIYLKN